MLDTGNIQPAATAVSRVCCIPTPHRVEIGTLPLHELEMYALDSPTVNCNWFFPTLLSLSH